MHHPPALARAFAVVAIALPLASCANTGAMRALASQTSDRITNQSTALNRFVGTGRQMNLDVAATIRDLQGQSASTQAQAALKRSAWALAGNQALVARAQIGAQVQSADIVAALTVTQTAPPVLDDGGAGASLTKASSAYAALAKKPGFIAQAKEVFAAGEAVQKAAQTIQQQAASAASSAAATPATVAKSK